MRQPVHYHYEQLTERERDFVDAVFDHKLVYELADVYGIALAGDDRVERAVDALARAVIESRRKMVKPPEPEVTEPDETHLALKLAGLL